MNKELNDNEDKRLMAASVYLNLYMDTLKEVVGDGEICFHEYGDENYVIRFVKKISLCWVAWSFWEEFSDKFSLQKDEGKSIIIKWVEDTYGLKGVRIVFHYSAKYR